MKKKGVTLVELMITLAIASIVITTSYSLLYNSTLLINKRITSTNIQNYNRLLSYYLQKDLQNAFSDEIIVGTDPFYDIKGIKYYKTNKRSIGSTAVYDLMRKSLQEGELILGEAIVEENGFRITPLSLGHYEVTLSIFNNGVENTNTFRITNRLGRTITNFIKITLDPLYDSTVKMMGDNNTTVDNNDDTWSIRVIKGTLKEDVSEKDILFENLPMGLVVEAVKGEGNEIIIKVSGTSSEAISEVKVVKVIVLPTAVTEKGALASEPVELRIIPTINDFIPTNYLLTTSEVVLNDTATVYGDIVIGRGKNIVNINKSSNLYGNVYVDTNLNINDSSIFGRVDYKIKLYVKGNVFVNKISYLHGDLFYEGTLNENRPIVVSGNRTNTFVSIPKLKMPPLKEEQWYRDRGYTVIYNASDMALQDNGRYYFPYGYNFNKVLPKANNFIIASGGNITFNKDFEGSGLIFAPNGEIVFNDACTFEGTLISKTTIFNKDTNLIYRQFSETPY